MKHKKWYYAFMILPLIVGIGYLFFLPDQIPMHYGAGGTVDRYGSKFESLLFPIIILIFGFGGLLAMKNANKKESDGSHNNEKVIYISMLATLVVFNLFFYYFLYTGFNNVQNINLGGASIDKFIFPALGILFIVIGNIIPKTKCNSWIGLRTKWSMKNETIWKKSQKFGGRSLVLSGVLIILVGFFIKDFSIAIFLLLAICILDAFISTLYTYYLAKKLK